MMFFKKRFLSLYESPRGLAYGTQLLKRNNAPVESLEFLDYPADIALEDKVKDISINKVIGVVLTVYKDDYQLFHIKRPVVHKSEFENAILWVVQDKIFFQEDDYILVNFPCEKLLPVEEVFVVAFKKKELLEKIEVLKKQFRQVISLKIPELSAIALCDYQDPKKEKFVLYLDNTTGKDTIYLIRNHKLVKSVVSPVQFNQPVSQESCLLVSDIIQTLITQYSMKLHFEVHISPTLTTIESWVEQLEQVFHGKVFHATCAALEESLENPNSEQRLAIGGGLAYSKEKI